MQQIQASDIPPDEYEELVRFLQSHPEHLDPQTVIESFRHLGHTVLPDPFGDDVMEPVRDALRDERAFSVIRLGDGEGNLLTYGRYEGTPRADRLFVKAAVGRHKNTFRVEEPWLTNIRDMMEDAVAQADIVGIVGIWRGDMILTVERVVSGLSKDPRGISGHFRAIDHLLLLAKDRALQGKIIASAHLYFAVLEHLDSLLNMASTVFLLTSKPRLLSALGARFPHVDFHFVAAAGKGDDEDDLPAEPVFLSHLEASLPANMKGTLSLVGAGPWAEIFCTTIKQRGGVAVDVGSGLDLLDGDLSRPIHRMMGEEAMLKYKL